MHRKFEVGQKYSVKIKIDNDLVQNFADLSGDYNPVHLDRDEAKAYGYPKQVAHGSIMMLYLSRMIGMEIPGPGAIWMSQTIHWTHPVFVDDQVELVLSVSKCSEGASILCLDVVAVNQYGKIVMKGEAMVKVSERLSSTSMDSSLVRRIALVTGGSRGIGAAVAKRLALSGITVAVHCYRSRHLADEVVKEIKENGGNAEAFAANLADPKAVEYMLDQIYGLFGHIDIIVHGATPAVDTIAVDNLRYETLDNYMKVYVGAGLSLLGRAVPGMKERKFGRFIAIGTSFMFASPPAGLTAYVAAKQSLWGLIKGAATELGPYGITSNMVSPSMTITDFTADIPARLKELEARKSPMRRLATSNDTAEAVRFLVSEEAGYLNGVNLPLTGGPL